VAEYHWSVLKSVLENKVFIVEKNGVYLKQLPCGIHLTILCVDKITHKHCLNEKKYFIVLQSDLTSDDKFFNFNTEFSLQVKLILICLLFLPIYLFTNDLYLV